MFSAPKLSSIQAGAANAACRLVAVAAREFGVELAYGGLPANGEQTVELVVAVNGMETSLFLSPRLLQHAARDFHGLGRDYEMPESLVAPVLEASAASWIARLEKAAGIELAVRRMTVVDSAVPAAAICFTLPTLPEGNVVAIRPPETFALPKLRAPAWTDGAQLRVKLPLVAAEVGVTVHEVEQLGLGDVVLVPALSSKDLTHVNLAISPGTAIIGRIDRSKVIIERLGRSMSTSDAAAGAKPAPAPKPGAAAAPPAAKEPVVPAAEIETLPLKIVFDLGDVEMTLAELKSLVPGQSIDLAREPGSAVRLTVNGVRIGAGEIVEIGGRLGVRITELAARNEPSAS
jgi:type III secretion system YscQ/HrcQ family protein